MRTEHGSNQTYDFNGDCLTIDVTNPEAREYLWEICRKTMLTTELICFGLIMPSLITMFMITETTATSWELRFPVQISIQSSTVRPFMTA